MVKQTMNTKFLTYIFAFLLCATLAVAGDNTLTLHYYNEDDVPVNDVAVWLFECTDSSCTELTGTLTADSIDFEDSSASNSVILTLPKTSRETFYVAYAFAEDTDTYLPHAYYDFSFDGGNVDAEEDLTLEKKEGCQSTIQSFKVTNTKSVGTPTTMSVDVASAFEYDETVYPWGYDASADIIVYQDWYSAKTEVTLTIYREWTLSFLGMEKTFNVKVYTTTETANILAGETEPIEFTWTPTKAGSYRATVMTDVVDAQCASSEKDTQSQTFIIEKKDDGTEETPDWPDVDSGESPFPSFDIDPSISSCTATLNPTVTDEEIAFETTPSLWTGLLDVIYTWDFGDGEIASGEDVTHTYAAAGTYTAIVSVTDATDGASDTCTITVEVTEDEDVEEEPEPEENIAPTVSCSFDGATAFVDEALLLEANALDSDGSLVDYAWNFGDGSAESTTESWATHTYTNTGTYTATFTVTDDDDATASCSGVITISEEPVEEPEPEDPEESEDLPATAVASANPMSGEPTLWVGFSSAGSSGDLPLSYYWTFGTGEGSSTHANPGHYYDEEGIYTATLTVVDADGDSDSATVTISIIDELENIAGRHYYVGSIALSNNGNIHAGETLEIYIRAKNIANFDKDAVSYNAIIQELGVYATRGEFSLDADDAEAMILALEIPEDTMPGLYPIRITISDDDVKRIVYRDVIVLS